MKRYLYEQIVEEASGNQVFYVDAETKEDADAIISDGGGEIYSEEIEVTNLGKPEFIGETELDDHGDFGE